MTRILLAFVLWASASAPRDLRAQLLTPQPAPEAATPPKAPSLPDTATERTESHVRRHRMTKTDKSITIFEAPFTGSIDELEKRIEEQKAQIERLQEGGEPERLADEERRLEYLERQMELLKLQAELEEFRDLDLDVPGQLPVIVSPDGHRIVIGSPDAIPPGRRTKD